MPPSQPFFEYVRPQTRKRFFSYVAPADENGCRRWLGNKLPEGYGLFTISKDSGYSRMSLLAHRFALALKLGGDIPQGKIACHARECPNKDCCAPEHLYAGTPSTNLADALADPKNEHAWDAWKAMTRTRGARHPAAKYPQSTRNAALRLRFDQGLSLLDIASRLDVTSATISRWCAADPRSRTFVLKERAAPGTGVPRPKSKAFRKFAGDEFKRRCLQAIEMRYGRGGTTRLSDIAKETGLHWSTVQRVCRAATDPATPPLAA
jgi:transcriptional regulator with XRE-family HTH domain